MSGCSSSRECPICGEEMEIYIDWKPIDTAYGECLNCGFCYFTKITQMSLKEINEARKRWNENNDHLKKEDQLKPLTKKDLKEYEEAIKCF